MLHVPLDGEVIQYDTYKILNIPAQELALLERQSISKPSKVTYNEQENKKSNKKSSVTVQSRNDSSQEDLEDSVHRINHSEKPLRRRGNIERRSEFEPRNQSKCKSKKHTSYRGKYNNTFSSDEDEISHNTGRRFQQNSYKKAVSDSDDDDGEIHESAKGKKKSQHYKVATVRCCRKCEETDTNENCYEIQEIARNKSSGARQKSGKSDFSRRMYKRDDTDEDDDFLRQRHHRQDEDSNLRQLQLHSDESDCKFIGAPYGRQRRGGHTRIDDDLSSRTTKYGAQHKVASMQSKAAVSIGKKGKSN